MAMMIPNSIQTLSVTTAGERKIFDIIKRTFPDDCIARYEMQIGMRDFRPDFTVIDPNHGVLILEIKDWGVENVVRATSEQFMVRGYMGSSIPKPTMNPELKCQIYLRETRSQLVAMASLRDENGRLHLPVIYLIAFPNITLPEFLEKELDKLIPVSQVLFKHDLYDQSKVIREKFISQAPAMKTLLSEEQQRDVTLALQPDIALPRVSQSGFIPARSQVVDDQAKSIKYYSLSLEQEEIAKSLGEGPRLLRGIAGTGKTLIMLYRAKLIAANSPEQRILILCWNTALANYMQQAYNKFPFDAKGEVTITHFTGFARKLLELNYDPLEGWDKDEILEVMNRKKVSASDQYDAVYIDEAQDFRKEWLEFIFNKLIKGEPKERNLVIAADDAQLIYKKREFSWSSLGIPMVGRSKILRTIYRNSARVWVFSAFLQKEKASYVIEKPGEIKFSEKGGYDPQIIECPHVGAQVAKAVELIKAIIDSGQAAKNILVLYRHKSIPKMGYDLVEKLLWKLGHENIPCDWIAQDAVAKRNFDWDADTVKISTVQSAKGMDSPIVLILCAETFRPDFSGDEYDETKMMYVALTRAREFLVVLYSGNEGLVPELLKCQEEYKKYRDAIISLEG